MANEPEAGIYIDGELVVEDDLTFREQQKMRKLILELHADEPDFDIEDAMPIDMIPAIVCVWKQRTDPEFSFNQALDLKWSDLESPPAPPAAKANGNGGAKKAAKGGGRRPTRASAA